MEEPVLGLEVQINCLKAMKHTLLFLLLSFVGCTKPSDTSLSSDEYQKLLKQTILPIPDSTLTKEQIELKIKLFDVLNEKMYVEDNCQKLSVGKDEFEKRGIPPLYYDVILYQMEETNLVVKKWLGEGKYPANQLNQDSLIKIAKERYWNIERPLLLKRLNN